MGLMASCRPAQVSASSPEVPRAVTQSVTSLESLVRSAATLNDEEINSLINNFIFVSLSKFKKSVHVSFNTLVRNLTRAQRHSGRQIRHEAGAVDRVQRKVISVTCHVSPPMSRVTCPLPCHVSRVASHVTCHVSGGPDLQPPGAAPRPSAQVRLPEERPARPRP